MARPRHSRPDWRALALTALLGLSCASAQSPVDLRLALVIGNAAYPDAPLLNPPQDARAMAAALQRLGFEVQVLRDADGAGLRRALEDLLSRLQGRQVVAAVYYAGHGVQLDDDNYLIPVDARIRQPADIVQQGYNISRAIGQLAASGSRLSLVVLDACRDNPFTTRQALAGLAPRDAPKGAFVAYATEPGNVAEDGDPAVGNGLYTQHLLREMARPAATIDDVFKRVRFAVRKASNGRQIPAYSSGLDDAYNLETGFAIRPASEAARAARFATQKAHWDRILSSRDPEDFYRFIDAYPESGLGELAQVQLERLSRRQIVAQAGPQETVQHPTDSRFRKGDRYRLRIQPERGPSEITTLSVTDVDEETARYSGGYGSGSQGESTLAGAVIQDSQWRYDPPYVLIPGGEYQVGKRWAGRSMRIGRNGQQQWVDYAGRVTGHEAVDVPAGRFQAYRVEVTFQPEKGDTLKTVSWQQPEWGVPLKVVWQFLDPAGKPRSAGTRELLERQRGP